MSLRTSIQDALNLTRSQQLMEATQRIQATLSGRPQGANKPNPSALSKYPGKALRPLAQVVHTLQKLKKSQFVIGKAGRGTPLTEPELVKGAQFITRSFSCKAGSRSYKLYVPNHKPDSNPPLLIMLHGCKQNPSDFAVGTRMNSLAETYGMLVAYPAQTQSHNPSACWNWFSPNHQQPGLGEPAIIAGLTAEIINSHDVDRKKVFVAGLSAGGAMAVVMGETYPELFSAVGVHSGLPYKSASDVISAFAAMRGDSLGSNAMPRLRTIVFHGDADGTVAASNGASIVGGATFSTTETECVKGQYTRRVAKNSHGLPLFEYWLLHGRGHAWSGGNPAGSYTDTNGPNASVEMLRFFLEREEG
jgi:poly(hydroxyalkanoate) depolymerase family esterase